MNLNDRDSGFSGADGFVAIGLYAALIFAAVLGLLFVFAGIGEFHKENTESDKDGVEFPLPQPLQPMPVREGAQP